MQVWDYGVAVGALVTLFGLFTWVIRFFMNTSDEREKRAEARERILLDALNEIIEKNSFMLEKQGEILDKQHESINQLSAQIAEVSRFIMCIKNEFGDLKDDINKSHLYAVSATKRE
jgi:adenosyl cobinamide kinase/adenosyl cobinamide phosphate guanylyltransferase